jgi:hypothetical protein
VPDEIFIQIKYFAHFHYFANLRNPETFNEKLQWLKLHDRNPLYTTLVDKYAVKKWVSDKIGKQYVIPTIGVWEKAEDIDFNKLPNQFVLKTTHDSGSVIICKDKEKFNKTKAIQQLSYALRNNFYWNGREWPYKNVPPRIIVEKYMEDQETAELRDYKFFCFNGEVKMLFIALDRQNLPEPTFDFYDAGFNHLDIRHGHPNTTKTIKRPHNFEQMKQLARVLSVGLPQVRVDFYEINGQIFFGEMTFFHHGGFVPFDPAEWDKKIGDWIDLSEVSRR